MSEANPYAPPAARIADPLPALVEVHYAGFWRRFGALWLDALMLMPLSLLILWGHNTYRLFYVYYCAPALLFFFFFHIYLVRRYGGTPGKRLLKLRIERVGGMPVQWRNAILRHAVELSLAAIVMSGALIASLQIGEREFASLHFTTRSLRMRELAPSWYFPAIIAQTVWVWSEFVVMMTNKRRRALQDFLAGTVVVHEQAAPAPQGSQSIH